MPVPEPETIDRFVSAAALSAVRIQRDHLDETHRTRAEDGGIAAELARAAAAADLPELARLLAPPELVLKSLALEARVHFAAHRERQLALRLRPLNLGFERRYGESVTNASTIRIHVEAVTGTAPSTIHPE